ncbi:hypothetical protein [Renibacterium salmoninarum]|uniref:hypothetical protein n=1 Tax=Renibacterium salmoninarum TaxID=1646 RepID=UPI000310C54D|nr:hypothetical protein [Renibacterium salmoninarum]
MKARGFVERAGMVFAGVLPRAEMDKLTAAVPLSKAEKDRLVSWADPGSWTGTGKAARPGLGKFLIKVGGRPGIPTQLHLTQVEADLNDTNKKWVMRA